VKDLALKEKTINNIVLGQVLLFSGTFDCKMYQRVKRQAF